MITLKLLSRQALLKVQAIKVLLEEGKIEEAKKEIEKILKLLS